MTGIKIANRSAFPNNISEMVYKKGVLKIPSTMDTRSPKIGMPLPIAV
jgi:hypothetical protein